MGPVGVCEARRLDMMDCLVFGFFFFFVLLKLLLQGRKNDGSHRVTRKEDGDRRCRAVVWMTNNQPTPKGHTHKGSSVSVEQSGGKEGGGGRDFEFSISIVDWRIGYKIQID